MQFLAFTRTRLATSYCREACFRLLSPSHRAHSTTALVPGNQTSLITGLPTHLQQLSFWKRHAFKIKGTHSTWSSAPQSRFFQARDGHSLQQSVLVDNRAGMQLLFGRTSCKGHTVQRLQSLTNRFISSRVPLAQKGRWRSGPGSQQAGNGSSTAGGFVAWYLNALAARPLLTKSVTASFILTSADLAAQGLANMYAGEGVMHVDVQRTARMATIGLLLSGPTLHLWFHFLSWAVPKRDVFSVLLKIVIGQTTYGPAFNATFFSINGYAQGESRDEIVERLRRDLLKTILNGLLYWPISDFVMFRYVPVHLQPLWVNSAAFFWTIYIAYVAGTKPPATTHELAS